MTENTISNRKKTNNDLQNTTRKQPIEQYESHKTWGAPEGCHSCSKPGVMNGERTAL